MLGMSFRPWLASLAALTLAAAPALAQRSTPVQVLQPSGAASDRFGHAVAIDGDTMIVGAPLDDVGANLNQGSASIYRWTGSGWTHEATLTAADGASGDQFGSSVALSGDTVLVGAFTDNVGANTDQGSAYVFTRSPGGTTWTQHAQLIATGGAAGDSFGFSVALSGNTALVGASSDDIGANIDRGSAFVFTRAGTTWTQQAQLIASDGATSDQFGYSVAFSGDTALVGAVTDTVGANGAQGSAYVFARAGNVWTQQAQLIASDGAASDNFGFSVALSGDTALVGASSDDVGANTDQGSAYVFTRSGSIWIQQAQLTATGGAAGDRFGYSVALSGDTALVGAFFDDVGANTDQGSASVFTRRGTTWTQQAQLIAPDGTASDLFGASVALSGDTAVIGAWADNVGANNDQGSAWAFSRIGTKWIGPDLQALAPDGAANDRLGYAVDISGDTAVVGAPLDDVGVSVDQGAAYVFVRAGSSWTQQAKLLASDGAASDTFGFDVAISGDTILVGAHLDDLVNTNQGSAYIFTRTGTTWTQQAKLIASDGGSFDQFGYSVALAGDTAVVGAWLDDVGANADQGSAYVFVRSGTSWFQEAKLLASDGAPNDTFGASVAISGDTALVGSFGRDVGANTNQGSAYVFTRAGTAWTEQAQLTASDGAINDQFGAAVALSGDTALIGSGADDVGLNQNQGSAYVFTRSGNLWTQQARLSAADGEAFENFGYAVTLSGDTAIVGVPFDDVGANTWQGSAYVFTRAGTGWTLQSKLTAPDGLTSDFFGFSVGLGGDTAIAGAYGRNVGANLDVGVFYTVDVAANDFVTAHNDVTDVSYPTLASALLPALSGHQITATQAAWRTTGNLDTAGRSVVLTSAGQLQTPSTSILTLGASSSLAADAGTINVFGQLRAQGFTDLYADRFRLGSRGILTARTGSSLTINAPVANLDGQTRLEQNASMTFAGSATAIGPTTANLNSSLTAGGTFTNLDTFTITSGTISAPLFLNRDAANIFGTSALFGSYTNDAGATTTIRSGTLFVFGSLTNNGTIVGTICAGCAGSPPTLDLTGSLILGPDANLTMPFLDALVRLGGNFDAAINNNTRYDMARAILQLEGTGAPQTLEAMSVDRGQDITALDRTIAGNFPIGTLRVGPNPSFVATVDSRDNDGLGQSACEAIYVDTLIIEAGSTLDTSACVRIYYNTLVNNGTVTDETKLVPIEPCAADFDGTGFLDSDDFVFYLDQFTLGCVGPGEDVFGPNPSCVKSADFDQSGFVDVDDFVAYLAAFEVGC